MVTRGNVRGRCPTSTDVASTVLRVMFVAVGMSSLAYCSVQRSRIVIAYRFHAVILAAVYLCALAAV